MLPALTPFAARMTDLAPAAAQPAPAPPAAPAHPWRDDPPLQPNVLLPEEGYGVLPEDGAPERCEPAELARRLAREPWLPAVFIPRADPIADGEDAAVRRAPVRPEDAGVLDEVRRAAARNARSNAAVHGAVALGMAAWAAAWYREQGIRTLPGFMAVLFTAFALLALHDVRRARRMEAADFPRARQGRRHWAWVRARPAPFTWTLLIGLGIVHLMTAFVDAAVPGAGLVKPAVWDGEAWRMLTGPMLHGGVYHAWMNLSALFALGYIVEAHTTRYHLAAVFLASVLGGSLLSLLLSPISSIGASGGVMGIVGFLWMLARLRPAEVPDDFGRRMNYVIGATAVLGVVGLQFIDNWAHLGGLLAGAGMGWLWLRDGEPLRGRGTAAAGILSLIVLLAAMAGAVAGAWMASAPR